MSGVRQIEIGADEAEQRLDRWLRRQLPELGQGRIEKLCRTGQVRVDGARAKASTRVGPGQVIRVPPVSDAAEAPPVREERVPELPPGLVIHQDHHVLALNKPHGLAVQGGSGLTDHLGQYMTALRLGSDSDPRLVHRLDRDTSGVLVLGRTGKATTDLAAQFRDRRVAKTYIAVVAGKPEYREGTIRFGLVKAGGQGEERMQVVDPDDVPRTRGAQTAISEYVVLEQLGQRLAVVALRPVTGRTHQLRAHMAAIGCPIAGDGKYAGRSSENLGDGWGAGLGGGISRKLHLHALALRFRHPSGGREVTVRAPFPEHMAATWEAMSLSPVTGDVDPFD
ncbi:MAG: RluA family pseudouridine synthase [Pseudomonadota bacterium]